MKRYKFLRFEEVNGRRAYVWLFSYDTGSEVRETVDAVKLAMQRKEIVVEGLKVDGGGLKIDTSGQAKVPQDNGSRYFQTILRELSSLKKALKPYDDSHIKQELAIIRGTEYATVADVARLEEKINVLAQALVTSHSVSMQRFDEIKDFLNQQNLQLDNYFTSIRKELPIALKGIVKSEETPYPVDKDDIYHKVNYTDNSAMFTSEEGFNEVAESSQSKLLPAYSESLFAEIDKHLPLVNNIRKRTALAYNKDISDTSKVKRESKKNHTLINNLTDVGIFFLLGGISKGRICSLADFKIMTRGVAGYFSGMAYAFNVPTSTKSKVKGIQNAPELGISARQPGIWHTFLSWDLDKLSSNPDEYDAYAIDIRVFVVDMLNIYQKRAHFDMLEKQHHKDTDYGHLLRGSMCRCPVDEDMLMRFYCKWIVARKAGVDDFRIHTTHMDEAFAAHSMVTFEAMFDAFVNAYFVAKKLCLVDSHGVNCLDFLSPNHLKSPEVKQASAKFLTIVKYSMMKQGISDTSSEFVIQQFVLANQSYGWYDIYLNAENYLSTN